MPESELITIKAYAMTDTVGSKTKLDISVDPIEWAGMSEEDKNQIILDELFNCGSIEFGWED